MLLGQIVDALNNPSGFNFLSLLINLLTILSAVVISLTFHEFAHAFTAVKLGDHTPAITGRLSLNPIDHLDVMGFLCMLLTGFGWAKPVQINPRNFKKRNRDTAITAAAGPLSNLLMSFVCVFILVLLDKFDLCLIYSSGVSFSGMNFGYALLMIVDTIILYLAYLGIYLAVFNLLPIPPLDGSRLVSALLPGKAAYYYNRYGTYFQIGLFAVLMLIVYFHLFNPIRWVADEVYSLFVSLWYAILGA